MSTTLRTWFAEFAERTGEVPEHIVFGPASKWYASATDEWSELVPQVKTVLPFADLPDSLLDREFDDGYGGNDSRDMCAWSRSWVIFSDNYDGAEGLEWVPRNPVDHQPVRPGGG